MSDSSEQKIRANIERTVIDWLQFANTFDENCAVHALRIINEQKLELKYIKSLYEKLSASPSDFQVIEQLSEDLNSLQAENKLMREALDKISRYARGPEVNIAIEALGKLNE